MNSFVNVQVRVLAAQAQAQLTALNAKINGMQGAFGKASSGASRFSGLLGGMGLEAFGSKVQWAGRQLEYNFTLPLVAAGAGAMKLALDNEAAFTRITKVYGDATHDAAFYSKEVAALKVNFEQLSNTYGVNQSEVLGVAASWAAAGASGIALAKSVDLTMQTMILGEMKASEATDALISIQAQYGFGVEDLTKTIATLNMVENQTGISLQGLVQGFQRSAGVARATGVDVRHLAAMLASLVPATGSAGQAGNALKTIFSRLISPTKETTEVLGLMGINIADLSWKSSTMTDRLITMAHKFEGLSDAQKGVVSSVAASRWQVNKFEVLMRDLINANGYYQKALQATSRDTDVFNQMNKELTAVLTSNPRRLQIIWTMLQNASADIITPMIPLILWLAQGIQTLVTAFSNLPQPIQLVILGLLAFMATIGPMLRLFGAAVLLTSAVARGFGLLMIPINMVVGALGFLLRLPVTAFLSSMGFLARGGIVALLYLSAGVKRVMAGVQIALLTGAAIAGRIWRAGMGFLATITGGAMATLGVMFRRAMFFIQAILLAGSRALGIAWRAGLTALLAIQKAWAAVAAISWSRVFVFLGAIASGGFTAIAGLFGRFITLIRSFSVAAAVAMTGPWGIAFIAVIALIMAFWSELKTAWSAIVKGTIAAFNSLPRGIHSAMMAVVNIVRAAVMAVYRLFSYLNPWAHHSPSLVENVTTGMDEVGKQFNRARGMGEAFKSAYKDMQRFGSALARLQSVSSAGEFADMRKQISGVDPKAIGSFDRLVKILPQLKNYLASIKPQLDAQTQVVAQWKTKLDSANDALDKQQKILDRLNKVVDDYQNQLSAAQERLSGFADAPIQGMQAMSDAIFNNEMQQKRLRLEMMKMQEAVGPMDDLQGRIEAINGQIEMLRGQQTDLRNAGAGSEILSVYDDQIDKLQQQQGAINSQVGPIKNLQSELDKLAQKGDILDLENSLKFDPLKRQIDAAANSMRELPFNEIMAGVTANKAEVDRLTQAYNQAKAAADKQQAVVDTMTASKDAIQARYDAESKALAGLQAQYDQYESQIRDIEQALKDAGSAAQQIDQARKAAKGGGAGGGSMSPGAENFKAGAGGNFGDPGGFAQIGREGGLGDQSKMIDDFTKEMADKTKNMFGVFNFLDPIKKGWNKAWGWVKANVGPVFSALGSQIGSALGGMNPFEGASSWIDTVKDIGNTIKDAFGFVWDMIGPEVIDVAKQAWSGLQDAFADIQPEIAKFRELVGPMGEALGNIWKVLKPVLGVVLGLILAVVKALIGGLAGAIGPVIRGLGELIKGIIKIIRGIIEFLIGVFTGDWSRAWQGIKDIFTGLIGGIWGALKNFGNAIWGFLKGFVKGFINFFIELYDRLVGHSIIPDMIKAIIQWITSLPGKAWAALSSFASSIAKRATEAWNKFKALSIAGWNLITSWLKGLPAKAFAILNALVPGLGDKAKAAFNSFLNGAKAIWSIIKSWITGRPGEAASKLAVMASAFKSKATEAMNSLKTGLVNKWNDIRSWVSGIGGRIKSALGGLGNLLSGIGHSIFQSLLDGMKNAWENAKAWLSNKASEIKNLKGPIAKDRVLLVDEGSAIIDGLGRGMHAEWNGLEGWLGGVSGTIQDTMAASKQLDKMLAYQSGNSIAAQNRTTSRNSESRGDRIINLYGNIELPNITNGDDAEELLLNLEAIIRGQ